MNRNEFLAQLERLLFDIPAQEREEALEYYNNYFDDAGAENESSVIQELGSPGKVAAIIKADLSENRKEYGEYTESGFQDERFDNREMPEKTGADKDKEEEKETDRTSGYESGYSGQGGSGYDGPYSRRGYGSSGKYARDKNGVMWGVLIVVAILTSPIWGGLLLGAGGVLIGLMAAAFSVFIAILACGLGLFGGGVVMIVYSIIHLLGSPATALAISGAGMVMMAVGILLIIAFLWLVIKVIPPVFRWLVDLVQRIFHRGIRGGRES